MEPQPRDPARDAVNSPPRVPRATRGLTMFPVREILLSCPPLPEAVSVLSRSLALDAELASVPPFFRGSGSSCCSMSESACRRSTPKLVSVDSCLLGLPFLFFLRREG
ncbi:unnamed protein product, partial [Prorocentrum cordatum]